MKISLIIVLVFVFCLGIVECVSAHTLKIDGSIGGVLHIAPDDDPKAGEEMKFLLEVKDKTNIFNWGDCECRLKIFKQEEKIVDDIFTESGFVYIFKSSGMYRVEISGMQPPFKLDYDVRVGLPHESENSSASWWIKIVEWLNKIFNKEVKNK